MPVSTSMNIGGSQVAPDEEANEYSANQFTEYSSVSLPSAKQSVGEEETTVIKEHSDRETFKSPKCEHSFRVFPPPSRPLFCRCQHVEQHAADHQLGQRLPQAASS